MGPKTNAVIFDSKPTCEGCGEVIDLDSLAQRVGDQAFKATKVSNGLGVEVVALCQNRSFHALNPEAVSQVRIFPAVNFPRANSLGRLTSTLVMEARGATRQRVLRADREHLVG